MRHTPDGACGTHPAVEANSAHYQKESMFYMIKERKKLNFDFNGRTLLHLSDADHFKTN